MRQFGTQSSNSVVRSGTVLAVLMLAAALLVPSASADPPPTPTTAPTLSLCYYTDWDWSARPRPTSTRVQTICVGGVTDLPGLTGVERKNTTKDETSWKSLGQHGSDFADEHHSIKPGVNHYRFYNRHAAHGVSGDTSFTGDNGHDGELIPGPHSGESGPSASLTLPDPNGTGGV